MGKYIGHRLVARPESVDTFWTDSTLFFFNFMEFKPIR